MKRDNVAYMAKDKKNLNFILAIAAWHKSGEGSKSTAGNRPKPMKTHISFRLLLITIIVLAIPAISPLSSIADTSDETWQFKTLQKKLIQDGFQSDNIRKFYQNPRVSFERQGVSLFFVHSEAKLNYDQFTNDWSIGQARKYMQKHRDQLENTEQIYGVAKQVITAIILVETGLGSTLGKRSVLNTLSSLSAFDDPVVRDDFWKDFKRKDEISKTDFEERAIRKSAWAYKELKAFLQYTQNENFDPVVIQGSYAGALGIAQFMPTTLLAYARDGNQDGVIDLFTHADAMASVASFLKRFGWKPGIDTEKARKIIHRYNHSDYYVNTILKIADLLS
jgi:membrane-bound lytic murein transglycosylase B